mgnify:FL=1
MEVLPIKHEECEEWLLKIHYAKRIPLIMHSFGLYVDKKLDGVITYGMPASPALCVGVCGEDHRHLVIELNRLCLLNNKKNQASFLVGNSLKLLPKPSIVVSYADTSMNHNGYIYQATNFIYTGLSAKRTEWRIKGSNRHSRTLTAQHTLEEMQNNPDKFHRLDRPQKHRYIYFLGNKKQKKEMLSKLNYDVLPYPKGENKRYETDHIPTVQGVLF